MISVSLLKNSARLDYMLKSKTGKIYSNTSSTESKKGHNNIKSICNSCKEKLNLHSDKFQKK